MDEEDRAYLEAHGRIHKISGHELAAIRERHRAHREARDVLHRTFIDAGWDISALVV